MKNSVRVFFALVFLIALGLTVSSVHSRGLRSGDRELMRLGIEDLARRVRLTTANLEAIREANRSVALAKARAFARLVEQDPAFILDLEELKRTARLLDVDELHVSDSNGVLIAGLPASYVGYQMGSARQSAAFLPAITNPAFELLQEPMPKGIDNTPFQYAGVARRDAPGIIQVGFSAARLAEAEKRADIEGIAASTRIGRAGRAWIVPVADTRHPAGNLRVERIDGARYYVLSADVENRRIIVTMPVVGGVIADDLVFFCLCFVDLVLLLVGLVLLTPQLRQECLKQVQSLAILMKGTAVVADAPESRTIWGRFFKNPVTLACAGLFLLVILVSGWLETRAARLAAEERLLSVVDEMQGDVEDRIANSLYFIGDAICRRLANPQEIDSDQAKRLLKDFNIDEINVVGSNGCVTASTIGIVGKNMWSGTNTAPFNANLLVRGRKYFSQPFRESATEKGVFRKYAGIGFGSGRGYIQIGFERERLRGAGDGFRIEDLAEGWSIGRTGFVLMADDVTGEILSCGLKQFRRGEDTLASIGFDTTTAPENPRTFFTARLYGQECLCLTDHCYYHRIVVAMPQKEIVRKRNQSVGVTVLLLFVLFVLAGTFMMRLTELVTNLKSFIAREKANQEKDLAVAHTVQSSSLPLIFPDEKDFKIFATMKTAREVGGDFYDFFKAPSGRFLFLIADVSGKGIPAAMFMMKARAIVKACAFQFDTLAEMMEEANRRLCEKNAAEMFVTAWVGVYDPATGVVEYANAGHNPPLIKRANGSVEWVKGRRSLVWAAMEETRYRVERLKLEPGDCLVLYTDGVTEAMNGKGELYGEARLEACLARASAAVVPDVLADLAQFTAGASPSDDITMLTLDRKTHPRN